MLLRQMLFLLLSMVQNLLESLVQETDCPSIDRWDLGVRMPIVGKTRRKDKQGNFEGFFLAKSLEELPARFAPWEIEHHQLTALLLDMQQALEVHGPKLDEVAKEPVEPLEALGTYLNMYVEYLGSLSDADGVRTDDEIKYGIRLAWRVWQQLDRSGKPPEYLAEWFAKS